MAIPLSTGRAPRMPRPPMGGMFAAALPPQGLGFQTPRTPPPRPPTLPSWYPWQTWHPNANPIHLARAMYRGNPTFASMLTPAMHNALFNPLHPALPPSSLIMAGAHPGWINPGLRFGPPAI